MIRKEVMDMSKKFKLGLTSALIAGSSVAAYQLAKKR